tara:strand:- start:1139 stop:1447 length:309 start_codon:yes stop_codon:yes gene_type:complete
MFEWIKEKWTNTVSFVKDLFTAVKEKSQSVWTEMSGKVKALFIGCFVVDVGLLIFAGVTGGVAAFTNVFAAMVIGGCVGWCVGMGLWHFINWCEDRSERLNG